MVPSSIIISTPTNEELNEDLREPPMIVRGGREDENEQVNNTQPRPIISNLRVRKSQIPPPINNDLLPANMTHLVKANNFKRSKSSANQL